MIKYDEIIETANNFLVRNKESMAFPVFNLEIKLENVILLQVIKVSVFIHSTRQISKRRIQAFIGQVLYTAI